MEKKKKMSIIVGLITLVLIITLSTTALWKWTSSNNNVGFTISGLDAYIIYNKGTDVLAGVLDPVANYTDTSVSTEITLYKNTSKTLYGHIYLDITTIGSNLANEKALKWVITSNDKVLNQGDFVGSKVGDSLSLKLNIPLSQTEQTFKIYIWLDESMNINDKIEGETLSTIVRAEASEIDPSIQTLTKLGVNLNTTVSADNIDFNKMPYMTTEQAETNLNYTCSTFYGTADVSTCLSANFGLSTKEEWINKHVSQVDDNGVFAMQDDLGTSYYYRGNVENNYVNFAGNYWRIIRINGDGTIRMIYDGPTKKHNGALGADNKVFGSEYNTNYNDNTYVGYMYGATSSDYTNTHSNTNDSTIKANIDKWYEDTIIAGGYDKYIADAIYCNDRKVVTGTIVGQSYTGDGTRTNVSAYAPLQRITSASPSLMCNQANDKFSVTSIGNGDLTYPVALLTIDEAVMGGINIPDFATEGVPFSINTYSYLSMADWYWTMSPVAFSVGAGSWFVRDGFAGDVRVDFSRGVRPVVSLKSDITFTGTGTYDSPFEISG